MTEPEFYYRVELDNGVIVESDHVTIQEIDTVDKADTFMSTSETTIELVDRLGELVSFSVKVDGNKRVFNPSKIVSIEFVNIERFVGRLAEIYG